MTKWRLLAATALLAAGVTGAMAAPAQAAPQTAPAKHCVLDVTSKAVTCVSSVAELDRLMTSRRLANLVRFWDGFNRTGDSATVGGPACTVTTGDIDLGWTDLGPLRERVSSVGKNPEGRCNWQLRGPAGATSTWVEGNWNDLRNLGDGWNDRAVEFRLT